MIKHILILGVGAMLLTSWLTTSDPTHAQQAAPVPAAGTTPDSSFELLACKPVHEAIADPLVAQPRPPPIVPKEPPALIEELQSEQQPQGNNVQWLDGYWAWDKDSNNFLWVGGIWCDLPPRGQWVPGYWTRLAGGWQRVPGFWTQYVKFPFVPPRAASVDAGPTTGPAARFCLKSSGRQS